MREIDKNIKTLNDGRMSSVVMDHIGSLIFEFKQKKLAELSQSFRMGKIDQATLVSSVAGLCALEDLENEMKRRITRSEKASNELNKEQLT
jgi:hypothetical protein